MYVLVFADRDRDFSNANRDVRMDLNSVCILSFDGWARRLERTRSVAAMSSGLIDWDVGAEKQVSPAMATALFLVVVTGVNFRFFAIYQFAPGSTAVWILEWKFGYSVIACTGSMQRLFLFRIHMFGNSIVDRRMQSIESRIDKRRSRNISRRIADQP